MAAPGSAPRAAPPPTSWAARYGEVILRDGVATIPWALYAYQGLLGLAAPEVWFVSVVLARKWDAELPHPSLRQIAEQTGVSLRQLQYLRAVLTQKAFLVIRPRRSANGGQNSNDYDFSGLFAHLEAAILAQPAPVNAIRAEQAPIAAPADPGDSSFVARFGRVLAGAGIIAVPTGLYTRQAVLGLSPQECWFITYILAHRWTADLPYPSLRKMAERTGYSVRQLHQIKEALVAQAHLRLVARYGPDGGQTTNGYDFSPLLGRLNALLRQEATADAPPAPAPLPHIAVVSRRGRRRTDSTETQSTSLEGVQRTASGSMQRTASGGTRSTAWPPMQIMSPDSLRMAEFMEADAENRTGGGANNFSGESAESRNGRGASGFAGGDAESSSPPGAETCAHPDAESFRRRRSDHVEPDQADDSNRGARHKGDVTHAPPPRYSPYIAATVLDYSRELGDSLHGPANVSQALRLWQDSGLGESAFVAVLQEARRRLRLYQGKQGPGMIGNKMAYWFRVVEDLVADGGSDPPPGAGS